MRKKVLMFDKACNDVFDDAQKRLPGIVLDEYMGSVMVNVYRKYMRVVKAESMCIARGNLEEAQAVLKMMQEKKYLLDLDATSDPTQFISLKSVRKQPEKMEFVENINLRVIILSNIYSNLQLEDM
ncbi:hypothetical protein Leryth_014566 [Lithospermum erythrorhizon]|nr:hypothetical protein Leryth_014566 [Lithospermum erythrorhizon]